MGQFLSTSRAVPWLPVFDEDAKASTLRTRLGFQSGGFHGFEFKIEMNDVREVISDNYNAGGGNTPIGKAEYAKQHDAGDNPLSFSADYWHLDAVAFSYGSVSGR